MLIGSANIEMYRVLYLSTNERHCKSSIDNQTYFKGSPEVTQTLLLKTSDPSAEVHFHCILFITVLQWNLYKQFTFNKSHFPATASFQCLQSAILLYILDLSIVVISLQQPLMLFDCCCREVIIGLAIFKTNILECFFLRTLNLCDFSAYVSLFGPCWFTKKETKLTPFIC